MCTQSQKKTPRKEWQKAGTWVDETASSVTHGLGLIGAIAAIWYIVQTHHFAHLSYKYAFWVYSASLIFTYLCSTLYHSLALTKARDTFKILDHSAIYMLIAGTYTPMVVAIAHGLKTFTILAGIWLCAITGTALGVVFRKKHNRLISGIELATYVGMGWASLALVPDFLGLADSMVLWLTAAGGICYTAGTYFYKAKHIPYSHSYWHLAVVAGSALHFAAVMQLM